jgi:predicted nucleic acid-binding protein
VLQPVHDEADARPSERATGERASQDRDQHDSEAKHGRRRSWSDHRVRVCFVDGIAAGRGRTRTGSAPGCSTFAIVARSMAKFVVHVSAVLHLAAHELELAKGHKLLAPTLVRSQTLSALYAAARRGELSAEDARERLDRIGRMPIRLLGDAVLRRRAWQLADQLGWAETYDAEYLALTQLQADAFVALDAKLARSAKGVVAVASVDELVARGGRRRPAPVARRR